MAHQIEESDLLIHPASSKSGRAHVPHRSQLRASQSDKTPFLRLLKQLLSFLPCDICIKSKAVMLILVWSMIIGAVYLLLLNGFGVIGFSLQSYSEHIPINVLIITVILAYAFLAIILLVYPLSGYFADVWCGRYTKLSQSVSCCSV